MIVAQTALFSPEQAEAQVRGRDVGIFAIGALIGGFIGYNLRPEHRQVYDSGMNDCAGYGRCGDHFQDRQFIDYQGQRVRPYFHQDYDGPNNFRFRGANGFLRGNPQIRCRSFVVRLVNQQGQSVGMQPRAACLAGNRMTEDPRAFGLPPNANLYSMFVPHDDARMRPYGAQRIMPAPVMPPHHGGNGPIVIQRPPAPQYRPLPPPSGPIYGQPHPGNVYVRPGQQGPAFLPNQGGPQFRPPIQHGAVCGVPGRPPCPQQRPIQRPQIDCRMNPQACPAVLPMGIR